jgi:hypothetical protein
MWFFRLKTTLKKNHITNRIKHTEKQKNGPSKNSVETLERPVFIGWYRREDLNLHALRH